MIKFHCNNSNGYKVISIPYFIQLDSYTINILFDKNISIKSSYPHGFIDSKCILPCDFCYLGLKRFKQDICMFKKIERNIGKSLLDKINNEDKNCVIPEILSINEDGKISFFI